MREKTEAYTESVGQRIGEEKEGVLGKLKAIGSAKGVTVCVNKCCWSW